MKKILFLGLITIFLYSSCERESYWIVTELYSSGNTKVEQEYYLDGDDTIFIYQRVLSINGNVYLEGALKNGERDGLWKSYFPEGTIWSETGFNEGEMDGETKTFFPNGKLRYSGIYSNGEKDGEWRFYDSTGAFIKKASFQENKGQ